MPEDGRDPLLNELASARQSIDLFVYLLSDRPIIDALLAAHDRGVRVRLVMTDTDEDGDEERAELRAAGVEVRVVNSPYIHAKLIVTDHVIAYVGSQNFTATSMDQNRELGVLLTDRASLERLASVFAADFAKGRTGDQE
jgi:cardiolipin synthase A/B